MSSTSSFFILGAQLASSGGRTLFSDSLKLQLYQHRGQLNLLKVELYLKPPNLNIALWDTGALHLELRSVTCNGAEENHAHRCDPYDLRVQEQPLFLVCSSINIFTSMGLNP